MNRILKSIFIILLICSTCTSVFAADSDRDPFSSEFPLLVLFTDSSGNELSQTFEYTGSKYGTIKSGQVLYLQDGDTVNIDLPEGTRYYVKELSLISGFDLELASNTEGTIKNGVVTDCHFLNFYKGYSEPGLGSGVSFTYWVILYVISGIMICASVVICLKYKNKA